MYEIPKRALEQKCPFLDTIIEVGAGKEHIYFCGVHRDKIPCLFYTNDSEFTKMIKVGDSEYPIVKEDAGECSYYLFWQDYWKKEIKIEDDYEFEEWKYVGDCMSEQEINDLEQKIKTKTLFHYEATLGIDGVNSMTDYHCSKMLRDHKITARTKEELKKKIIKAIDTFAIDLD